MIAIKRKKSSGKMKTKFTLMKISAAVVFIQVANTSDALIGKFLQVKKLKNKYLVKSFWRPLRVLEFVLFRVRLKQTYYI